MGDMTPDHHACRSHSSDCKHFADSDDAKRLSEKRVLVELLTLVIAHYDYGIPSVGRSADGWLHSSGETDDTTLL